MIALIERILLRCIETICLALLLMLTAAVIYSTTMRYFGASPSWYDEIASVLLAWLTYFGAVYALFHRQHMSFGRICCCVATLGSGWAYFGHGTFGRWFLCSCCLVRKRRAGCGEMGFSIKSALVDS